MSNSLCRFLLKGATAALACLTIVLAFLVAAAAGPAPGGPGSSIFSETRRFNGHRDSVWSVAFSPDGKRAISGSYDRTLRLWDVDTGRQIFEIADFPAAVMGIAFLPDGQSCVACCSNGSVHLCDLKTGKHLAQFQAHNGSVNTLDLSRDGKTLATGGADGAVKIWELPSGKAKRTFAPSGDWIWSVAISPSGKQVLAGGGDKSARLWDIDSGKELIQLGGHKDTIDCVAFSPDGKEALTGSNDGEVRLWMVENGQVLKRLTGHKAPVYSVLFSREGRHAFTAGADGVIRAWDVGAPDGSNNGMAMRGGRAGRRQMVLDPYGNPMTLDSSREVRRYEGHDGAVYRLALSPDGRFLLSGGRDGTVRLWETHGIDSNLHEFAHAGPVHVAAILNNGNRVVTLSLGVLRAWDADRGIITSQVPLRTRTQGGRTFEQAPNFENPSTQTYLNQVCQLSSPGQMAVLTPAGALFLWSAETLGGMRALELPRTKGQFRAAALSRDGKELVTGDSEGAVAVWDAATGKEKRSSHFANAVVGALAVSPDERDLLVATWREEGGGKAADVTIRRLDRKTFKEQRTFEGHTGPVTALAFAPNGLTFLSGSRDGTVRWWGLDTKGKTQSFKIPGGGVSAIAFVDNERFVSAGADYVIRLWTLLPGTELQRFDGHQGPITGLAYSPTKNLLLSASLDRTARLWKLGPEPLGSQLATKLGELFGTKTTGSKK